MSRRLPAQAHPSWGAMLPYADWTKSKRFCVFRRLKTNNFTRTHLQMNWRGQMSCTRVHTQTQSLRSHRKKAEEVSVGGSVAPTRDDKRQLSSRHCVTLCTCKGWMEIHGWGERERGRDCVLGLKLAMIPPQGFTRTCRVRVNTCMHRTSTQTHTWERLLSFSSCAV